MRRNPRDGPIYDLGEPALELRGPTQDLRLLRARATPAVHMTYLPRGRAHAAPNLAGRRKLRASAAKPGAAGPRMRPRPGPNVAGWPYLRPGWACP